VVCACCLVGYAAPVRPRSHALAPDNFAREPFAAGQLLKDSAPPLRLRGGARSTRSIKKQHSKGLQNKMKKQHGGKAHGAAAVPGGGSSSGGSRGRAPSVTTPQRDHKGAGAVPVKRADAGVLRDKHRPAAVPAAAWALLGTGDGQGIPEKAVDGELAGKISQDIAQMPPAPVSYLPPERNRRDPGRLEQGMAAEAPGDGGDGWQWHDVKAKKDSSQGAFTSDLNRILAQADVLLEVLDARDPDGCRCCSSGSEGSVSTLSLALCLLLGPVLHA